MTTSTLVRRVTYADDDTNTIVARDITSLRFQTLIGQVLYNRSDLDPLLSGVDAVRRRQQRPTARRRLVARNFRDNNLPWWADLQVKNLLHTFEIEDGLAALGTFGNDYLAGGPEDDLIFGQLGNDIIMGDGSIQSAIDGTGVVGASRSPDGCVANADPSDNNATAAGTCDLVGDLDVVPTFEIMPKTNTQGEGDGSDYIEGGGGNDIVFGGLGQDDIIGGSSELLLTDHAEPAAGRFRHHLRRRRPAQRPQRQRRSGTRRRHPGRPSRTRLRHDHRRQRPDHPHRRHQPL